MILFQRVFDFRSQTAENGIIGGCIVFAVLTLIEQGNVDEGHQRDGMLGLTPLVCLRISVVTVCNELGSGTVINFVLAVHRHLYILIIDVQPYM